MDSSESLAQFIEAAGSGSHLRVEADLGDGFYRLRIDEAERRQAIQDIRSSEDALIEMLRNARDAHARIVFVATSREGSKRTITMIDDGDGIPEAMHSLIFEPRVTSKLDSMSFDRWGVHGRGMALYSISTQASTARVAASGRGLGASIVVESDVLKLPERTDQSTFPAFFLGDDGTLSVRGPKNLIRTACEFALEQRVTLTVYFGSPSEIAATLYGFGLSSLSPRLRAFADVSATAICKRLALAADDEDFSRIASEIGLELSPRTARRIIDGQIAPVPSLLERIEQLGIRSTGSVSHDTKNVRAASNGRSAKDAAIAASSRAVRIEKADLEDFAASVKQAYVDLARAYYLDADVEPHVSVSNGMIRVYLPIVQEG